MSRAAACHQLQPRHQSPPCHQPRLSACNFRAFSTFLALFNVFSYDAGIVALSVWPAWLVVVALTLAPWIFNPGAHQHASQT